MNTKIKLRVQGLTNSQVQSGAYALVLAEENGLRRVPIIVGTAEAQSIAIALEHITPPRPLTHDLFVRLMQAVTIRLVEVVIYKFEEGVFFSELVVDTGADQIRIDSRTSDAIAIALRMGCDIYTTEEIIKECGVVLEDVAETEEQVSEQEQGADKQLDPDDIKNEDKLKEWLSGLSSGDLQEKLDEAIASENYEYAKLYKDEQARRDQEDQNV